MSESLPGRDAVPTDSTTTMETIKQWLRDFSRERDWEQFHHPKDLGVALACEVGELLEHFRFREHDRIRETLENPAAKRELAHEAADCLWALVRLADVCEIDLSSALSEKLMLAAQKYPIDKVYGRSDKYTAYE